MQVFSRGDGSARGYGEKNIPGGYPPGNVLFLQEFFVERKSTVCDGF